MVQVSPLPPEQTLQIRGVSPQDAAALTTIMATRGGTRSNWAPAAQRLLDNALVLLVAELTCPERPPASAAAYCRRWSTRSRFEEAGDIYSVDNSCDALSLELQRKVS